jgi:serine/threonine protein kinase
MELLTGEDLRSRLQREGMLSIPHAMEIATQILRGLVRAHAAGIVHRDLKPDNIFLSRRDDGSVLAKIVDFGISKLSHGRAAKTLTRRGTVLGTAYYMAPEQAQAAEGVDHRADLYGAGTILFEMLAGRPPHMAPTHEAVLVAICTKDAPDVRTLRPDTPSGLARTLERALARDRDARIASAQEFLEELAGGPGPAAVARAHTATSGAEPPLISSTTERRRLGTRRTAVAGVMAALLGFTLTAVLVARSKGPAPSGSAEARPKPVPSVAPALPAPPSVPAPVEVVPLTNESLVSPEASAEPSASTAPRVVDRRLRSSPGKPSGAPQAAVDAGVGRTLVLSPREP